MNPRVSFVGLDSSYGQRLREQFLQACQALELPMTLADDEHAATHAIVDMDSVYGPMSWIRLHGQNTLVVGLTSAPRTNAEYHLPRNYAENDLHALLRRIAADAGMIAGDEGYGGTADANADTGSVAALPPATGSNVTPLLSATTPTDAPMTLAHWLRPGTAGGRFRFQRGTAPALWIDSDAGVYHGSDLLKPLAGYFTEPVALAELQPLDSTEWNAAIAKAGPEQSLARLRWYHALLNAQGHLPPGHDAATRIRMPGWQASEREFPRHFRIATAMLRGPATLAQIAEAANVPEAEAADFIHASLVCGHAAVVPDAAPIDDVQRGTGGLFARLRGR